MLGGQNTLPLSSNMNADELIETLSNGAKYLRGLREASKAYYEVVGSYSKEINGAISKLKSVIDVEEQKYRDFCLDYSFAYIPRGCNQIENKAFWNLQLGATKVMIVPFIDLGLSEFFKIEKRSLKLLVTQHGHSNYGEYCVADILSYGDAGSAIFGLLDTYSPFKKGSVFSSLNISAVFGTPKDCPALQMANGKGSIYAGRNLQEMTFDVFVITMK